MLYAIYVIHSNAARELALTKLGSHPSFAGPFIDDLNLAPIPLT